MNTPPFLIGAAALFWGWQTGFWPLGALAAILLEAPRWIKRRFEFELLRQRRIADWCLVLAAMVGVGCYVAFRQCRKAADRRLVATMSPRPPPANPAVPPNA